MRRATWRRRRGDESGYAAILVALMAVTIMLPLCAISVDVARWYVEIARVQNAADAAAAVGVTWLPDDFASATTTALAVADDNGYPNSGDSTVKTSIGAKPTQLTVTISARVPNQFAASFGVPWTTVTRSATADYNGPAPMGSPCNAFGNEPAGSSPSSVDPRGPSSSVIVAPPGGAVCSSTPQFWAAIAGPDTPKGNGDQYMTRTCGSGNDGCTGGDNDDFSPQGYFYIVRVAAQAVNQPVTLQIYDPAWVETGDLCNDAPTNSSGLPMRDNMNPYTTTDGRTRYHATGGSESPNSFCTGDVRNGGDTPIVTSFGLRKPTDTYQPNQGTPITTCEKQYPGFLQDGNPGGNPDNISTGTLAQMQADGTDPSKPGTSPNSKYDDSLAQVFHQWVNFCTFTPTQAGDYYLQVRTNVALDTHAPDGNGGYTDNDKVFSQTGDDTSVGGSGNNRFALRVKSSAPSVSGAVSISGWQNMSIYANYSGAPQLFNLVRVIPAAQTKTLTIHFFDIGDATAPTTATVLPPIDATVSGAPLTSFSGCTGAGVVNGPLGSTCGISGATTSTYNGKIQTISVPIPSTYTCNSTQAGGCWVRVQLKLDSSGSTSDTTTWSASIDGDPVRVIK
jgi:Flp pilus assembly protein TadG